MKMKTERILAPKDDEEAEKFDFPLTFIILFKRVKN